MKYCGNSSELEIIEERKPQSPKTGRKSHQKGTNEYLHKSKKEKQIKSKVNNYEKLLQEVLNVCNSLSREMVQKKKNYWNEHHVETQRLEDKDSIFESYQTNKMNSLERYYHSRTEVRKDKIVERKDKINKLRDLVETDNASCRNIDKFDLKKKKKTEKNVRKDENRKPAQYREALKRKNVNRINILELYCEKKTEIKNNYLIIFLELAKMEYANQIESQGCYCNRKNKSKALTYKQESATTQEADEIYQASVRRAINTYYMNQMLAPGLETSIEVKQETSQKYRRYAKIDIVNKRGATKTTTAAVANQEAELTTMATNCGW
ncbi:42141_t:CDS:2 [Gigaspora margarita]|uniref:42141_t:CDS:1 n=1 Tax=Gigaspora margarita TaxID=4874 RepID=A0ABN7VC66_GIGMA|nr:42141_t:CDS:2 [Gigaspora margarita]